jgi:hypothetical protein
VAFELRQGEARHGVIRWNRGADSEGGSLPQRPASRQEGAQGEPPREEEAPGPGSLRGGPQAFGGETVEPSPGEGSPAAERALAAGHLTTRRDGMSRLVLLALWEEMMNLAQGEK